MDEATFWRIIEETHDVSMEKQEERLYQRLSLLSGEEIVEFDRLADLRFEELYSWELWGVAYLAKGGCSDDGFMDWRFWIVYCGKEAFETARDRPDDLIPVIDAHPDAGCEGIGYVTNRVLEEKEAQNHEAIPERGIAKPDEPRGKAWEEDDLERLLPKTWKRYRGEGALSRSGAVQTRPWWKFWQ